MDVDAFPINLVVGDDTHREARIVISGGRARAFVINPDGQPEQVAAADVEQPDGRRQVSRLATADGTVWVLDRAAGCGCHSPLKRVSRRVLDQVAAAADAQ